ncbi:hypothetical protein GCM10022420_023970 [Streptomyces iranensis]|uniref:DUF3263 domain-containing protein n=1 Tax=Streptomyces iranensis TaxID=576784 RepID=A0A060ZZM5_9ACTN|nr:hypothetical protein [Streptomyces iranensis]CDR08943.1 predicted protein [Streptomyces iranensis]
MTVDTPGPGPSDDPADQVGERGQGEDQGPVEGQGQGPVEDQIQGRERDQDSGPDHQDPGPDAGLSERDLAVLAVERRGWPGPGAKERAIRERLGLSPTRYYQLLNALLDDPRALEHDPVTVNRLRRVRDERRERR